MLALVQTDIKRMLAYSSISHAGYVLVGLQAATDRGVAGSLFYLLAYTFMVLGSFGIVTLVGPARATTSTASRPTGAWRPGARCSRSCSPCSCWPRPGVPLTSGFLAKFYVIGAAVDSHSYALAVIAMLAAVIAAFFYLRVIVVMYMGGRRRRRGRRVAATRSACRSPPAPRSAVTLAFTLVVGFLPSVVIEFARDATLPAALKCPEKPRSGAGFAAL